MNIRCDMIYKLSPKRPQGKRAEDKLKSKQIQKFLKKVLKNAWQTINKYGIVVELSRQSTDC